MRTTLILSLVLLSTSAFALGKPAAVPKDANRRVFDRPVHGYIGHAGPQIEEQTWVRTDGAKVRQVVTQAGKLKTFRGARTPVVVNTGILEFRRDTNHPDGRTSIDEFKMSGANAGEGRLFRSFSAANNQHVTVEERYRAGGILAHRQVTIERTINRDRISVSLTASPTTGETTVHYADRIGHYTPERLAETLAFAKTLAQQPIKR